MTRPRLRPVLPLLPLLLLGACGIEEAGINPEKDALYFPANLVLDQSRPYLYVTNTNADLLYNGGAIAAVSLKPLPRDLSLLDAEVNKYAADSTTGLDCSVGVTDTTVWECGESQFIDEGATLRLGDFPASMQASSDGKRIFVNVRGQNYLLWANIVSLTDGTVDLRCDDDVDSGCGGVGLDRDCTVWDCDSAHRVDFSDDIQKKLPGDPFGLFLNELTAVHVDRHGRRRTHKDGLTPAVPRDCQTTECTRVDQRNCCYKHPGVARTPGCTAQKDCPLDYLFAAHISGGEVSLFTVEATQVKLRDIRGGFFRSASGIRGGYWMTPRTPGDPQGQVFVSSRVDNELGSFKVKDSNKIINSGGTLLKGIFPGSDARGIVYHAPSERLYAVNRQPPTLLALDMSEKDGIAKKEPLWAVEVCSEPTLVRLGQDPTQPNRLLAYVVCFTGNKIFVVDTVLARVIDQIPVGKGPYSLVLDGSNKRAFIANFLDNTIGVIDLDPSHARFNRMALRIGRVDDPVKE